jgi:hypothetical protein
MGKNSATNTWVGCQRKANSRIYSLMKPSVCVYQVNCGHWDHYGIKDSHAKQTYPCDFVYYIDDEENLFPLPDPRPPHLIRWPYCMQAKAYRIFPNKCKKLEGYDLVIHLDAQDQIINLSMRTLLKK